MKRFGNLMCKIADVDNLLAAYYKAARGKRLSNEVSDFELNLEDNIYMLREQLLSGTVVVGDYKYFYIHDPKLRLICAASFRERVLHHAIMNVCHEYFERNLIYTTYATRPQKGVYQAIDRASAALKKHRYFAKFDFRKYFDSISHNILKEKLQRLFKDRQLLELLSTIINSYSKSEGKGIPIGNLTSQYFANFFLSSMDHYIKEILRIPNYVRYMDDFLVFADTVEEMNLFVDNIRHYAEDNLKLTLKPVVTGLSSDGVSFLGYHLFPNKKLLTQRSKKRYCHKSKLYALFLEKDLWCEKEYYEHITPLLSYTLKGYTKGLRKKCLTA